MLHMPTIKPIDERHRQRRGRDAGLVVTVEEQTVLGGLGGAVAEVASGYARAGAGGSESRTSSARAARTSALLEKYRLSAAAVAADVEAWLRERPARLGTRLEGAEIR